MTGKEDAGHVAGPEQPSRMTLLTLALMLSLLPVHVTSHACQVSGTFADCRGRGLTSVPSDLPPSLTSLDLSHNEIRQLKEDSFGGLAQLAELSLRGNKLSVPRSYPRDVFSRLGNLTTLDVSQNSVENSTYPSVAMTSLTRLESLTLDLLPRPLPQLLSGLDRLTSLTLYTYHWTRNVSNETFSSLAEVPLQRLQLSGQDLHFLHRDAFQPVSQRLQQLEVVDLPSLSLPQAIAALHVFRGRNMSVIRLEGLSNPPLDSDTLEKHVINETSTSVMRDLCVKTLSLARNAVVAFDTYRLADGCFRTSLTRFAFGGNYLPLVPEIQSFFFRFKKLEYVDFSTGSAWQFPSHNYKRESLLSKTLIFRLAPSLSYLNVSRCILKYGKMPGNVIFINASQLHTVDISYCGCSHFVYTLRGLENITLANVSGNDLSVMNPELLGDHQQLRHFSARDTSIDPQFLVKYGKRFFERIRNLEYIDLSENRLSILPSGIFQNLQEVILSMNYFSSIPLEVDSMPRLVTLDLTFNSIAFLSSLQRNQLDARAQSSNGSFRLLLEGNPLSCDCSVLDFVSWLSSTSVRLDRGGNYSCITDGGVFTTTAEVAANLDRKWRECVGSWWLGTSSAWLVVTLMMLVLAFLVSRFWTNVQHVVLRALGFGHALLRRADFRCDVYVAYSDEDYRFACLDLLPLLEADGLRVYVRDRDEPVGANRAEEVVRSVGKSWCIVFLLTEAFLRDEWCQFTALTAARCSASPHGPGRVLLVLLRPLPRADLPPSLLTVVEEQDVFDLGDEHPGPALWGRLLHRLGEN